MVVKPEIPSKEEPAAEKTTSSVPTVVDEDDIDEIIEAELQDELQQFQHKDE